MALASVTATEISSCPFPSAADVWTVIDDDVVIVAGRVRDRATAERVLDDASEFLGRTAVLSDVDIDARAQRGCGALVLVDSLAFEDDVDILSAEADSTLGVILAVAEQYDEVLCWVAAGDDRLHSNQEHVELSRRRVAAIHHRIERSGRAAATVRVEQRDGDLTVVGAKPRRRYAVRIVSV